MVSLACPACRAPMVEENFASARVDVCDACAGIWFDRGELNRVDHRKKGAGPALQRALAVTPRAPRPRAPLTCARCALTLAREAHAAKPEVHIERCPGCDGLFLDGGELAVLRARQLTPEERAQTKRRQLRRRKLREDADKRRRPDVGDAEFVAFMLGVAIS